MQIGSPRPPQQRNQLREDSDFGKIGISNRNQRFPIQNARQENQPLLLSTATKMQQNQEHDTRGTKSGERLTNLHSQLYQQTEKLKQWKINTEIQISDKDRKITEASKTIESLRKSILELQFLNESVSSKLHDEKTLQEETIQKIATTRNMCNALKEHLVKLENGVVMGENMLEKQRQDTQVKVDQFEELALKFQELEIKVIGKEHEMDKLIKEKRNDFEKKIEELQQRLKESRDDANILRQINDAKEGELLQKKHEIRCAMEEIEKVQKNTLQLMEQIDQTNKAIKEYEDSVKDEKRKQEKLKEQYQEMEQRYAVQAANLESMTKEREEEIRTHEADLLDKSKCLFKAEARITHLSENIEAKNLEIEELLVKTAELESSKSKLELAVEEMHSETEAIEKQLRESESKLMGYTQAEMGISKELEREREVSKKIQEEVCVLKEQVDKAKKDRIALKDLSEKIQELETSKEELQFQANFALSQIEDMTSQLQALTKENQTLNEKVEEKSLELSKNDIKQAEGIKKLEEAEKTLEMHREENCRKTEEITKLRAELQEICRERENKQGELKELMETTDEKIASTESKVKSLEEKALAKAKQISKFQSDIKALKAELKRQEKLTEKQENELAMAQEKIDNLEKEKIAIEQEFENKEITLMERIKDTHLATTEKDKQAAVVAEEVKKYKNQAETCRKQNEQAQNELKTAKQTFDAQIAEMCSTLEKYKVENEKLMNAREKELDKKTKDILESKKKLEDEVKEKNLKIKDFAHEIAAKEGKITELEKQIRQLTSNRPELESQFAQIQKSDVEMIDTEVEKQPKLNETNRRHAKGKENKTFCKTFHTPEISTTTNIPQGKQRG